MRDWTEFSSDEFARLIQGIDNLLSWSARPQKICTDTRVLKQGDIFFAVRGENFNGNQFVFEAISKGAVGVVLEDWDIFQKLQLPAIYVQDSVRALGLLAAYHRQCYSPTVIGITGSNGKTTTKDLVYHLLSPEKKGVKSEKSFNNFLGVPLTLLSIKPDDQFAIVEMGTNHSGEISYLRSLVQPDFAVITSIGPAHLEGFETVQKVADEKCSIVSGAKHFFFSSEDPYIQERLSTISAKLEPVGKRGDEQTSASQISSKPYLSFRLNQQWDVQTTLLGEHNWVNVLLAIAIAKKMGLNENTILPALASFKGPKMRMESYQISEITLINDAYNANPVSMQAAIRMLGNLSVSKQGRKILVAGEMGELGNASIQSHQQAGQCCVEEKLDQILTFGEHAKAMHRSSQFQHFLNQEDLLHFLKKEIKTGDIILFKGSRRNQLEKTFEPLLAHLKAS
ncbi:MAG: UDP-N-acetylmuramoyl-tripeptide--D-alanyl-D-alanine ligase [Planctomycetota bacterium]